MVGSLVVRVVLNVVVDDLVVDLVVVVVVVVVVDSLVVGSIGATVVEVVEATGSVVEVFTTVSDFPLEIAFN